MRALITGCTGQDAAYLSAHLLSRGYKVVGTSPRRSDDGKNMWRLQEVGALDHPNFEYQPLDVTCAASVTRAVAENQFDQIYNLAAQSFVKESFDSPIATAHINYIGVLNLLEAIRQHSPDSHFYQASTSEMFGLVNAERQDESTPFHPRSPYGVAKAAAHYAVQNYREAHDLYCCSGILFNHESPLRGIEFVTRKITDGVAAIVAGDREFITLGNTEALRDWGHAADYVRAMNLMLEQDEPDDFVIATGETHSVQQFIDLAFAVAGLDAVDYIKQDERYMRPAEVPMLRGDATKARDKLGWAPYITFNDLVYDMMINDLHRHGIDYVALISESGGLQHAATNR